ncbi:MAG TPA: carboxypeptidase regulatory-like domain-containing protein [Candidatus Dormibacteraeota bacterium]|nr:carboxypeptidase regulatory-like domain-containing protein [Candidatus Dormibacteraeota bacterium]
MINSRAGVVAQLTHHRACAAQVAGSILGLLLLSAPLLSQTYTGRILGTVTDQQDAAIVGAKVVITDVQRGISRTLITDESGDYVAPDLTPGEYKIRVEAKGFNSAERQNVMLEVAKDARLDFTLKPGDSTQVITVTQEIPLLDRTSSALGGTLSNKEINDLPLNGRNYENLLQLRPGVVRYPGGGFSTTSTNGLRAEDNAYIIDGLFNSEPFSGQSIINGAGIAGDSATILPVDAIQEFNVIQNPPAEYGWKPGTMVNVGLKSGTNSLHGTAYGFVRTTALDARNYYDPVGTQKSPRNLKQFGTTVGGPIAKDKLFFFGAYEGQRYTVGNVGQIATPATVSLAAPSTGSDCAFTGLAGGDCVNSATNAIADVHAAFLAGQITNDVSAASLKIAGCTMSPAISCNGTGIPLNNGTNPAGITVINFGLPNSVRVDNALGKLDYQISEHHTLSGLYFFGNNNGTVQDAAQLQTKWLTQIHTRAQVIGLNWVWIPSSVWTNEARFGYNRLYQPTFPNDHSVPATTYGLNTGVTNPLYGGLPRINVLGFFGFPISGIGGFNWPKVQGPDDRFQFVDHVSRTLGKHAFKFGGEVHRDRFSGGAYGGTRGRFKFLGASAFTMNGISSSPIEDFFAGAPLNGSLLIGDPTRNIHNWGIALFAQDDWRISRNLTLNLGLRYELNTVLKDAHNQLANFDPNVGLVQVGKGISGPYNIDPYNFAPRVGFAWDVGGNNRTVIRGGAGIIYETVNWESFLALNNSLGLATIPTGGVGVVPGTGNIATGVVNFKGSKLNWNGTGGATVFPTTPIDCSVATGSPCSILGITQNIKTPYVYTWNLNVQHALNSKVTLQAAYVGNHGSKLVGIHDINQNVPALDTAGDEQSGRPFNVKFPFLSFIYQMGNIYKSNYNGLQATLTGRDYHGFTFIAGYTYSHALDNVGANWDFGAGSGLPQDSTHPMREYASSDFDMRHRLTLSTTYSVPGKKSFAQLLEGWQITSIVSLFGAQPWGPIDAGTDVSHTGEGVDRWNFSGNPADFKPTRSSGIPWFDGIANPFPAACLAQATTPALLASLNTFGCYAVGSSVMTPPAAGTFGTMGRNTFRDFGFRNWDMSVVKNTKFGERLSAQFRAEFFNVLNHPNFANPFGGQNGWGHNDPSVPGPGGFGCSCATPDVAASNPVIGSGGSRAVQLGLKLIF